MLNKTFWKKINKEQDDYVQARRLIISRANEALHLSKQVIFALHRDNAEESQTKLTQAREILIKLEKDFGENERLRSEGAWGAAVEEFVEANLFNFYINGQSVGQIKDLKIYSNEYIAGLSDYTGELVRRAVLLATKRKVDEVKKIGQEIQDAIYHLLEYNLTKVLRTKFDQAKRNLQKIEHILYELSLKD
jgi:predicted translin family RNA/ssDNA-binding protein